MQMIHVLTAAVAAVSVLTASPVSAQQRCVTKEYAQYKDQLATSDGRWNLPLDYCITNVHQGLFDSATPAYAECSSEMSKMKDAMLTARLSGLVSWAEAGCKGDHPLSKPKRKG